jgi:DtxR family Mn-dependent transcriptional regulator
MSLNLSSSLEDYLETIVMIYDKEGTVRVTDISRHLGVEKSSVNSAINKLANLNLLVHEKYGDIQLTRAGEKEARRVLRRHIVLLKFLTEFLGLNKGSAEKEACRIEHVISKETFNRLYKFIRYIEESPFFNIEKWLTSFEEYIKTGENAGSRNIH